MPEFCSFKEKVVVATGAAGHIGGEICRLLFDRGATVVAVDRPGSDFSALASHISEDRLVTIEADVREETDVRGYVDAAVERFGRIDVFFNGAGVSLASGSIPDYPLEDFRTTMDINVVGVFLGLKYVIPIMERQGAGVIVNAGSVASLRGSRNISAYVASKHAVLGLTKVAANESAAKGVRVVAIAPGPIDSPLIDRHLAAISGEREVLLRQMQATVPQGRMGTAREVAALVAYLASDEASYCNGAIYSLDGALLAG